MPEVVISDETTQQIDKLLEENARLRQMITSMEARKTNVIDNIDLSSDAITAILSRLEEKEKALEQQQPRAISILQSFRVRTTAAVAAIVTLLQELDVDITESTKQTITWVVIGVGLVLIFSDTFRKIGG